MFSSYRIGNIRKADLYYAREQIDDDGTMDVEWESAPQPRWKNGWLGDGKSYLNRVIMMVMHSIKWLKQLALNAGTEADWTGEQANK